MNERTLLEFAKMHVTILCCKVVVVAQNLYSRVEATNFLIEPASDSINLINTCPQSQRPVLFISENVCI